MRIFLNPCSCSREVCIYSCTPSIQLLFHLSGCRMKLHKECAGAGQGLAPCKVSYDPTTAKEMLLMATSLEEQQFWTGRLLKKIQKGGYKAAGQVNTSDISGIRGYIQEWQFMVMSSEKFSSKCSPILMSALLAWSYLQGDGTKISPQESMRSQYKPNIQVQVIRLNKE